MCRVPFCLPQRGSGGDLVLDEERDAKPIRLALDEKITVTFAAKARFGYHRPHLEVRAGQAAGRQKTSHERRVAGKLLGQLVVDFDLLR
jgi:hypothetical protein